TDLRHGRCARFGFDEPTAATHRSLAAGRLRPLIERIPRMTTDDTASDFPRVPPATVYVTLEEFLEGYHGRVAPWTNPLPIAQTVEFGLGPKQVGTRRDHLGRVVPLVKNHILRVTVAPNGGTAAIPSIYDSMIHRIECAVCNRLVGVADCLRPTEHEGTIIG